MAVHRVFVDSLEADSPIVIGDEAHHAVRVKRLTTGDPIACFDGKGNLVQGRIAEVEKLPRTGEWSLRVDVEVRSTVPRSSPHVELWTALPKGGRASEMIEGLSEVGAALWAPLNADRSVAEPGDHKLSKLQRAAVEASKQCARPWLLDIGEGGDLDAAFANVPTGGVVLVADGAGEPISHPLPEWVRVLVGPEGGWSDAERSEFARRNARLLRCGPHIMRLETAAVAAATLLMAHSRD